MGFMDACSRRALIRRKYCANGTLGCEGFTNWGETSLYRADSSQRTKAAAESIFLKANPKTTIVRPSIVFGPGDSFFTVSVARFSPREAAPAHAGKDYGLKLTASDSRH